MKIVRILILLSITCSIEFSVHPHQLSRRRSLTHIDTRALGSPENDFTLALQAKYNKNADELQRDISALFAAHRDYTNIKRVINKLEIRSQQLASESVVNDQPAQRPSSLLAKKGLTTAGLSVITAGLTARYLHSKQVKFEPFSIMMGLGLVKSAAGAGAVLAGTWFVLNKISKMLHGECREREKNMKLEAQVKQEKMERDYKETAQELKDEFEKFKKSMKDSGTQSKEALLKKFDEYKNSMDDLLLKYKKETNDRLEKALQKAGESEDTVKDLVGIKEQLEQLAKTIHDDLTHAVERLKKSLRIIEGLAKKLPEHDQAEARFALEDAETHFNNVLAQTSNIHAIAAAVPTPKVGFFDRVFHHRRTSSRGGTHSRKNSLSSMSIPPQLLATLNTSNLTGSGTPPQSAQYPHAAQSPHAANITSPSTPANTSQRLDQRQLKEQYDH